MFVCNECLQKRFTNGESMFKSRGRCEICEESKVCNEIQSSRLVVRRQEGEYLDPRTGLVMSKE